MAVFTSLHYKAIFYSTFNNSQTVSSHHSSAPLVITEVAAALLSSLHVRNVFKQNLSLPAYYASHKSLGACGTKDAELVHHAGFDQSALHHPEQNPYLITPPMEQYISTYKEQ